MVSLTMAGPPACSRNRRFLRVQYFFALFLQILSLTENQHVARNATQRNLHLSNFRVLDLFIVGNFTAKCCALATPGFFHPFDQHYKLFEKFVFIWQPLTNQKNSNEYPPCPRTTGHKADFEPGRIRTVTSVSEIVFVDLKCSSQPWKMHG